MGAMQEEKDYLMEFELDGRKYIFKCSIDAPIGHVKEALFQFNKYLGQVEDRIISQKVEENASE